jgi:hypothetical protein
MKIKSLLKSTWFLTNGLIVLGGVLSAVLLYMNENIQNPDLRAAYDSYYSHLLAFASLLLFITSGLFMIIRREIPRLGLPSIKGRTAVAMGIFLTFIICAALVWYLMSLFI